MRPLQAHPRLLGLGIFVALLLALILLWDWNWLRPLLEQQASAALGRSVSIGHFEVHLARHPQLVADHVTVANPEDFPAASRMATIDRLAIRIAPWPLLHHQLMLDEIDIERPQGDLKPGPSGAPNYKLGSDGKPSDAPSPWQIELVNLIINDGDIHFFDPKLKSDFTLGVKTEAATADSEAHVVVAIDGKYAAQPISGRFIGGSVLGLRDSSNPYSIDLKLANGATRVSLQGTLLQPMNFGGADLKLDLQGNDLAALYPLTGIPLAPTPPYHLSGELNYAARKISFDHFAGTVGSSDLSGDLAVDLSGDKPRVTADLLSKKVVLADLAGFIGAPPGKADAANESKQQKDQHAQQDANPKLLPDTPINLPKLRSANLDIRYQAAHIDSDATPLDNIVAHLKIEDEQLSFEPLSFAVGQGSIVLNIRLDGRQDAVHTVANIDFRKVDLHRIMQSTKLFEGAGTIGGNAHIDASGNSLAKMLGNGDGDLKLVMSGGDMSALLIDLAGLDFGNGVLSALGIPRKADLRCMVTDFGLTRGVVDTRLFVFDTTEANVTGGGKINLHDETIDYRLATEPKHFNIGAFRAPILIRGALKNPSILPDPVILAARGGAAVLLGVVATPLAALIPTIQLGLGADHNCAALMQSVNRAASGPSPAKASSKSNKKSAPQTQQTQQTQQTK
ncbi:MAG: AsmA family protein [Nevskia sp.]|nr:AsmA family protein [Nevskia sp.]